MLEQRDSFFTKGSHAVHLLFHLPTTAWTFSKTSAVGITSSQTWGRGKEALKQEDNVLVIQWQLAMSGRAPPKSIKNKLTHLSFLRLLGTSTGTAVDFLTTRCTYPKLGSARRWMNKEGQGSGSAWLGGLLPTADTQGWHKKGQVQMKWSCSSLKVDISGSPVGPVSRTKVKKCLNCCFSHGPP